MKKHQLCFCLALGLAAIALSMQWACARSVAMRAQAKSGTLEVAGLRADVTVRRDERGVPHVEAANQDDLYFAQGYVVASDRLWQMDLLRRTAAGELAEILGQNALEEDKRRRAFGFAALAEQLVGRLSPPVRASLEAYANGVNAYIAALDKDSLPLEFRTLQYKPRPWRPADSLMIGKLFAETLSSTWQTDMMRDAFAGLPPERVNDLLPSTSPLDLIMVGSDKAVNKRVAVNDRPPARPDRAASAEMLSEISEITETLNRSLQRVGVYAEDLAASNNWVVSGRHSVTGKPLLANDPHLQPSAPSIWYMIELSAPGLHVAGVTVAGNPGVFIGHNDAIAWGITNVEADVQDVYLEKFDPDNPRRYQSPTGWREAETRSEEIKVRKSPTDPAAEPVAVEVVVTRHGPVLLEKDGARYAVAWPTLDPAANEFEAYYQINRARNWNEFRTALSGYTGFPLNFIYADVNDHIGYWAAGRYPIRKTGHGTTPYDGATDAGDWTGYIPFDSTPHVYDPPSGIIVTANNRLVGSDYPYYITDNWAAPYRARRIYELLTAKEKLSVEDFRAIQGDTYSYPDAAFVAELARIGQPLQESSPEWQDLLGALKGSDATLSADSSALSAAMRDALLRRILAGTLGDELAKRYAWSGSGTFLNRVITTQPREWLPKEFDSYQALYLAVYKDAQELITKRLGTNRAQWTWGRLAQVRFQHPLAGLPSVGSKFAVEPVPQNGGNYTVNRGALVSMRLIADLSNWDDTRQGIPLGESGDPASPHWKDQLESWQTVKPPAFAFSRAAVAEATKETLILAAPKEKL
ncbi:MAG TPA: penicillin acylase family protein [Blastocatellia bacterium]|nr:penicillin acylase family protein [Blastocatellia bacterium]